MKTSLVSRSSCERCWIVRSAPTGISLDPFGYIAVFIAVLTALLFCSAPPSFAADARRPAAGWGTVEKDGVQWLVTPDGKLFYSKGVNFVDPGRPGAKSEQKQAFYWRNFFPSLDSWRRTVGEQLTGWGFNTRGGWSDPSSRIGLPLTVDLELGRNSKFHWFDPFDPSMERRVMRQAERLTAKYRNSPDLLGYFTDNEVGWWNSPLFEWYLSKGWENHTKRVLWNLLNDRYGGDWNRLLDDWTPDGRLSSFEDLKGAGAKLRLRPGGHGIQATDRFMYVVARHYYELMHKAIRHAHPGALILGDRLPLYYHQDAVLAIGDNVDVISTNYNVDVPDGWVAPYYFDGLRRLTGKPVLVTEFFFAAKENRSGNRNETARSDQPKPGHLMTVATQADRARGAAGAVQNFARFPNIVGTHWFQYCDEPFGGREDGEDYNMGLIDTANRPYDELTQVFRQFNPQLEEIHKQSAQPSGLPETIRQTAAAAAGDPPSSGYTPLQRALKPIDVTDQSLMDWDKGSTLLHDFQAPKPYVPFADVHAAWTPDGLHFASISNTHLDPAFMAYRGEFPQSEAFQMHLLVQAGEKLQHFVIYLLPYENPLFPDGFEIKPKLYRYVNGKALEPLPVEGHVQRLEKSLPHMLLEAFIPVEWLGVKELEAGMKLRMNVVVTNYFNEMTMSWSGEASLKSAEEPAALRTVVLERPRVASEGLAKR